MTALQDSYLKSLNPSTAIKFSGLGSRKLPEEIVEDVYKTLTYKYRIFLDRKNSVIYVGKKV